MEVGCLPAECKWEIIQPVGLDAVSLPPLLLLLEGSGQQQQPLISSPPPALYYSFQLFLTKPPLPLFFMALFISSLPHITLASLHTI